MATQSRLPAFLLTRPTAQSARFADQLRQRFGQDLAITISPLLAPTFVEPQLPSNPVAALIFTSETGVAAYQALQTWPMGLPTRAYCVGARTAKAAKMAGLEPVSADGDAAALIALLRAEKPEGLLLHICGNHTRGEVAQTLTAAGLQAKACVAYRQTEQPLTPAAIALLTGESPVLVPLFSPRSATLFCDQALAIGPLAPLTFAVLSKAVGESISNRVAAKLCYADKPTAESLIDAIAVVYAAS
ncbi:MAG: uroporphyrinogen-III synthase [Pseudorhodobacter sp.]